MIYRRTNILSSSPVYRYYSSNPFFLQTKNIYYQSCKNMILSKEFSLNDEEWLNWTEKHAWERWFRSTLNDLNSAKRPEITFLPKWCGNRILLRKGERRHILCVEKREREFCGLHTAQQTDSCPLRHRPQMFSTASILQLVYFKSISSSSCVM